MKKKLQQNKTKSNKTKKNKYNKTKKNGGRKKNKLPVDKSVDKITVVMTPSALYGTGKILDYVFIKKIGVCMKKLKIFLVALFVTSGIVVGSQQNDSNRIYNYQSQWIENIGDLCRRLREEYGTDRIKIEFIVI